MNVAIQAHPLLSFASSKVSPTSPGRSCCSTVTRSRSGAPDHSVERSEWRPATGQGLAAIEEVDPDIAALYRACVRAQLPLARALADAPARNLLAISRTLDSNGRRERRTR
jgi:hypothetical protein